MSDVRAVMAKVETCFNSRRLDDLDDIVDESMVNHAAGPQGREGWKQVWRSIFACFPDAVTETHAVLVDGEAAAVHATIVGTHEASVMPLLDGIEPSHKRVRWEFIHLMKVADGVIVEHRACRDDLGLLRQIEGPAGS
jgi:lactoylglutathione lyase